MKKILFIFVLGTITLLITAACAPNSVVQVNKTATESPAGTPVPNGQINVPGVSIQVYAPGANPLVGTADMHGSPAGFWLGLWHGIISLVTLVISFIGKQNVQMYEVHNDGSLYNLGFFLGVFIMPAVLGLIFGSRR